MQHQRQRVDWFTGHQHVELDQIAFPIPRQVIVERRVAARSRFQAIIKIQHDFVERQLVGQHHAIRGDVFKAFLLAALFFQQRQDSAQVFFGRQDRRANCRLFNFVDAAGIGHLRRRIDFRHLAVGRGHYVTHARRRGDEIEIEFAFQTFLHDLHVQ